MPWALMTRRALARLRFRADAGDQLAVGLDGLIAICRQEDCPVADKLEGFLRMHKAYAAGDMEELDRIVNEIGVRPCPQK